MNPVDKHYLVEINIPAPAAGQRIYIGDIPQLRDVLTTEVESYISTILSVSPTQQSVVSQAGASNIVVTLTEASTEDVYQIPYNSLSKSLNGGFITEIKNKKFNLNKSYITLFGVTGIIAGQSVVLSFYYR